VHPNETLTGHDGLVLRRLVAADAPRLHAAIVESIEHLRPWMPWIQTEPLTVSEREQLICGEFARGWDEETDFAYGIFTGEILVGGCGLHRRIDAGGMEIGYWVHVDHTGRGIATAAVRALCEAAFRLDEITHVEIHHDKANTSSARVPAKLGFTLVREIEDEVAAPGEVGLSCEWRLDRPPT
jgi:RimJ/RimL family protein N-acetyltransferase